MPDTLDPSSVVITDPISTADIRGEACFHYGAVPRLLGPAGCIALAASGFVRRVVTCGCKGPTK
ncbi:hypothetical protein ACWEJP_08345 [Streptomyces sp. NPDC004749]